MKFLAAMVCALLIGSSFAHAGEYDSIIPGKTKLVLIKDLLIDTDTGDTYTDDTGITCFTSYYPDGTYILKTGTSFSVSNKTLTSDGIELEVAKFTADGLSIGCSSGATVAHINGLLKRAGFELR